MKENCCNCDPRPAGVALARWALGVLFLVAGTNKFVVGVPKFAGSLTDQFKNTWLPSGLVSAFAHALPILEVAAGVLLVLGLARNAALFGTGVLLLSLMFGQLLLQQSQGAFQIFVYVAITGALLYAEHWDRWVVPCCNRKPPPKPIEPGDLT